MKKQMIVVCDRALTGRELAILKKRAEDTGHELKIMSSKDLCSAPGEISIAGLSIPKSDFDNDHSPEIGIEKTR